MKLFWRLPACGTLVVVAGLAAAQTMSSTPSGPNPDHTRMQQMRAARQAQRADDEALLLGLRPDQRAAFDRFRQAMYPSADGNGMRGPMARDHVGPDATVPARLDAAQARADQRDAMVKQRIAATRQFYASLSPDQQRRFDALERLRHEGGHERHGRWSGMGGRR